MNVILSKKIVNTIPILGIVATIIVTIYFIRLGVFKDINALRGLVGQSAILDLIISMSAQVIQVVIPVIPGDASCAAGVSTFGPAMDFVYNYVGTVLGPIIIFLLGRNYGRPFIMNLASNKTCNKYIGWLDNEKRFERLSALATFSLIVPDDTPYLVADLIRMLVKKFTLTILLAKPAFIYLYSPALVYGNTFLTNLLGM